MAKKTTAPDVTLTTLKALYDKRQPKWSSGVLKNPARWMAREKKKLLKKFKEQQEAAAK